MRKILSNKRLLSILLMMMYIGLMVKFKNIIGIVTLVTGTAFIGYLFFKNRKFKKIKRRMRVLSTLGILLFMVLFGVVPILISSNNVLLNKNNVSKNISIVSKDSIKKENKKNDNLGELKVSFIDIGQANSILVQQGNNSMLIDGGNAEDANLVKSYITSQGIGSLDAIIGTHPHEDHIGGLSYIMNTFKVGKIYLPEKTSTSKIYEDLIITIKNKNIDTVKAKVGEKFNIGNAKCTILAPRKQYEKINDNSIVLKMEFGEKSFLFMGDAEATSEMDMVKNGSLQSVDLLKVGHHGSKTSSCIYFLKTINPKYAIISVGKNNKYGHPNQGTLNRLKQVNAEVYRTDKSGTIVATSNGKEIKFNTNTISKLGN